MLTPDQIILAAMVAVESGRGAHDVITNVRHAMHVLKHNPNHEAVRRCLIVWGRCMAVCVWGLVPAVFYASHFTT